MPTTAVVPLDQRQRIVDFIAGFTLETTPGTAAKIPDYRAHARPGASIYVTCLQGAEFDETLAVARRLRAEGFEPVPHVSARSIRSRDQLDHALATLSGELGVRHVFCIAGAAATAIGPYTSSMQLLETGLFDRHGITRIGVAGHPEGSPDIPERDIQAALRWKNDFANRTAAKLYLVTQFCFEAAPIIAWDRRLQAEGNRLPIHIGVPGLATIRTLLQHAKACGIGPSMGFLRRQAANVARLMSVSAPDRLVTELAAYRATDPRCGIAGVHLYPLGGLKKTADWAYAVQDGRFRMNAAGTGFEVDLPAA